jgi:hypothetical protein
VTEIAAVIATALAPAGAEVAWTAGAVLSPAAGAGGVMRRRRMRSTAPTRGWLGLPHLARAGAKSRLAIVECPIAAMSPSDRPGLRGRGGL